MIPRPRPWLTVLVGIGAFAAIAQADGCTPAQVAAVPAEERIVCVLLKAADPAVAPYCATADELAPLVPLLAAEAKPDAGAPLLAAFAMPAPTRAHHLRLRPCLAHDAGGDATSEAR